MAVKESLVGLELSGAHKYLCADDADLRVKNMNTIKKNVENLLDNSKEGDLQVNKLENIQRFTSSGMCHCTMGISQVCKGFWWPDLQGLLDPEDEGTMSF
jgi:hypothetical protein